MRFFPESLKVENKDNFKKMHEGRTRCYMRRAIYEYMVRRKSEEDYFSLEEFDKKYEDLQLVKQLSNSLIPELEKLGWKCKFSYGGTALFIYSTEKPPKNCWEDGF